jgi:hypothetical protein
MIMATTQSKGLQTIFSFFLGLMVTAFVGVGVYTFHPSPQEQFAPQRQDLSRREVAVRNSRPSEELADSDRDQLGQINEERNALTDASRPQLEAWGRSTSIVLIIFATLVMAVSLVRADQLPVISNGLLLGGVFTMVYGVGWIIATNASMTRFAVMTVAFAITLALGYVRFVRRDAPTTPSAPGATSGEGLTDIEKRVSNLEDRLNKAASALGTKTD